MANTSEKTSRLRQILKELNPAQLQLRAGRAEEAGNRWRAFAFLQAAIFVHTARGLRDEEITRRAAALTYHTLLSIVPVLAVAFALFKAFGGLHKLEAPLRALVVDNLAAGRGQEVGQWLDRFIGNINAGAIAGVGIIFLFYTALGLLSATEQAFNKIWGIERGRPLHMRFAIYWAMLTLAPLLIGLSLSISARLQSSVFAHAVRTWLPFGLGRVLMSATSLFSVCIAFVFLYQLVPNTKVRFRHALLGGIVAGLLWSASKVLFLVLTAGSVKYSAIYGALGALPLIMLWTYLSWIIVLFGVTYTLANQTISTTRLEDVRAQMSQETLELVAVRLLALAAKRFDSGDTPLTSEALAAGTGAPTGAIHKLIRRLVETKLLQEVSGPGDPRYTPARSIESITLADVLFALRRSDASPDLANETSLVTLRDLLQTSQVDSEKELASWTFARVVEHLRQTQVPASTSDDDSPPSGQPASTSDGASPSS